MLGFSESPPLAQFFFFFKCVNTWSLSRLEHGLFAMSPGEGWREAEQPGSDLSVHQNDLEGLFP